METDDILCFSEKKISHTAEFGKRKENNCFLEAKISHRVKFWGKSHGWVGI